MRLSREQIQTVVQIFSDFFREEQIESKGSELYLFGSRIDPNRKGGDIDLLLETDPHHLQHLHKLSSRLLVKLKERLGEQKIDLVIIGKGEPLEAFHREAMKDAQRLYEW